MQRVVRRKRTLSGKQRRTNAFDKNKRKGDKVDSLFPSQRTKTRNSQPKLVELVDDLLESKIKQTIRLEVLPCQTSSISLPPSESEDVDSLLSVNRSTTIFGCDRILVDDLASNMFTTTIASRRKMFSLM